MLSLSSSCELAWWMNVIPDFFLQEIASSPVKQEAGKREYYGYPVETDTGIKLYLFEKTECFDYSPS